MIVSYVVILLASFFLIKSSFEDFKNGTVEDKVSIWYVRTLSITSVILALLYGESIFFTAVWIGLTFFMGGLLLNRLGALGGADIMALTGTGEALGLLNTQGWWQNLVIMPYWLYYLMLLSIVGMATLILLQVAEWTYKKKENILKTRIRYVPVITIAFLISVIFHF